VSEVWYFAYGSNMQADTFRGRRGVEWARAMPVRARGWRLVLDKPPLLPGAATSYANIVPDPDAEVLGVAYHVTEHDLAHIELTEGVAIGNYERVAIDVTPLADPAASSFRCWSLHSTKRAPELRPSERYLRLLVCGAEEHGLPAAWIAWLRSHPCHPESAAEQELRSHLDEALRALRPGKKEPR